MDVHTKKVRSKSMKAIKSSGSKIEKKLAKSIWAIGCRYRKNDKSVYGKPDFVFKGKKAAVFCDGEFWHGKDWEKRKEKLKTNKEFWIKKIEGNIKRDQVVNQTLSDSGWKVIRFWGEDILKDPEKYATKIKKILNL